VAAAIQAGDHGPRTQFIENMFIPTSDRQFGGKYIGGDAGRTALGRPRCHEGCSRVRLSGRCGIVQSACAAAGSIAAAHAASVDNGAAADLVNGCTVGAGHFNQLEVPDQVNAMIEAFLRHYV
jgi:hypothetical protein